MVTLLRMLEMCEGEKVAFYDDGQPQECWISGAAESFINTLNETTLNSKVRNLEADYEHRYIILYLGR